MTDQNASTGLKCSYSEFRKDGKVLKPYPCTGAVVFDGDGVGPSCCVEHIQHAVREAWDDGYGSGQNDGRAKIWKMFRKIKGRLFWKVSA